MSAPEWIQQAEGWCASVENSSIGVMMIGLVVTSGNVLVFRALIKRLRRAFPGGTGLRWLVGILFWLLLSPMIAMAIGGTTAAIATGLVKRRRR